MPASQQAGGGRGAGCDLLRFDRFPEESPQGSPEESKDTWIPVLPCPEGGCPRLTLNKPQASADPSVNLGWEQRLPEALASGLCHKSPLSGDVIIHRSRCPKGSVARVNQDNLPSVWDPYITAQRAGGPFLLGRRARLAGKQSRGTSS